MFNILFRESGNENLFGNLREGFNFDLIRPAKVISMAFNAAQAPIWKTFRDLHPLRPMKRIKVFESLSLRVFPLHIYLLWLTTDIQKNKLKRSLYKLKWLIIKELDPN